MLGINNESGEVDLGNGVDVGNFDSGVVNSNSRVVSW